jgi:hypothetical protein
MLKYGRAAAPVEDKYRGDCTDDRTPDVIDHGLGQLLLFM